MPELQARARLHDTILCRNRLRRLAGFCRDEGSPPISNDKRDTPGDRDQAKPSSNQKPHTRPGRAKKRGDPGQRPSLVFPPAPGSWPALQRGPQPCELRLIQSARRTTWAFGGKRSFAADRQRRRH